jgi:signal transduction histidine kinase
VPPFWETWWFRICLAGIAAMGLLGGYRWRVKTVEAHSRNLERLVHLRTDEIEQRNQQMEALYRAGEKMYRYLTLDQVLQALADVAVDTLQADKSAVFVWDKNRAALVLAVARGVTHPALWQLRFVCGEGIVGEVAASGEPASVQDVAVTPRWHAESPELREVIAAEGVRSLMFLPIKIGQEVFGVFGVCAAAPRAFGENDRRLFMALAQRAAVSIENAQLFEQTRELAVVEERSRLARDLHDSAKQKAFAALAQLGAAGGTVKRNPALAKGHLAEAENLVYEVIQELTFLIQELYPRALKENGLVTALREYVFDLENRSDLQIDLKFERERQLSLNIEQALYRIAQEALANVVRHSRASAVKMTVLYQTDALEMVVADNGQGFNLEQRCTGMGLRSMRERAEMIDGTLRIESAEGQGTRILVSVPLKTK